jgi:hypothetical protein
MFVLRDKTGEAAAHHTWIARVVRVAMEAADADIPLRRRNRAPPTSFIARASDN